MMNELGSSQFKKRTVTSRERIICPIINASEARDVNRESWRREKELNYVGTPFSLFVHISTLKL